MKLRTIILTCLCTLFCNTLSAQGVDLKVYYAKAIGEKKENLKSALHSIIAKADVLDYGKGAADKTWAGFYKTDRIIGTNEVRDRYSNDHRYFDVSNPYAAVSGMNIEHSLANSWWGGSKNQAYKDIHHLMPCQTTINSSKGNYGMGKVTTAKTDNGCTKVGTGPGAGGNSIQLWEPADKWKGDFARVYFYMVTCYSDLTWKSEALKSLTNTDWPTLQPWAYELYLQWDKDTSGVVRPKSHFPLMDKSPIRLFPLRLSLVIASSWSTRISKVMEPVTSALSIQTAHNRRFGPMIHAMEWSVMLSTMGSLVMHGS